MWQFTGIEVKAWLYFEGADIEVIMTIEQRTAIDRKISEAISLEICRSFLGTMLFVDSLVL